MAIQISGTTVIDNSRNITNASIAAPLINSGTVAAARLGSGTANSTTFLRGDQTWSTGGLGFSNMQVFTSPGTFTTPPSTTKVKVTVTGGGGGYSCVALSPCTQTGAPGSGGATGIAVINLPGGCAVPITVGAAGGSPVQPYVPGLGGSSCFGNYVISPGGINGNATCTAQPFNKVTMPQPAPTYQAQIFGTISETGYNFVRVQSSSPGAIYSCGFSSGSGGGTYWGAAAAGSISPYGAPVPGTPSTYGVGAIYTAKSCTYVSLSQAVAGVVVVEW